MEIISRKHMILGVLALIVLATANTLVYRYVNKWLDEDRYPWT